MTSLIVVASLAAGGCVGDPFTSADGAATQDGAPPDSYVAPDLSDLGSSSGDVGRCTEVIDLVFVLDVSSSMSFVLDTLEQEIDRVVSAANKLKPDAHFGLVAFVDNHRVDSTGAESGGVVHVAAPTLQAAFRNYKNVYTAHNRNPGDGPNGPDTQNPICEENALDAIYAAAEEFPWRQHATRIIIVATDDTFLERPDNYGDRDGDGKTDKLDFPREGDYPAKRTLGETVALLKKQQVRVFSFTHLAPPGLFDLGRCGTGRRLPWSAVSAGWSTTYNGAAPIPDQSGGKNFDLKQVQGNLISLTSTINGVVLDSHCKPIL
ncbi:MAG: VWA domain-containing protein [Myxococcales bacterium]|nr:VWA domain-containing protein [Myxococcales bacterium]